MNEQILQLCKDGVQEWKALQTPYDLSAYPLSDSQRLANEQAVQALVDKFKPYMEAFPKSIRKQKIWRKQGEEAMLSWLEKDEIFRFSNMDRKDGEIFYRITMNFIKDARNFDDALSLNDIGQALRNVWIIVILQRIFGYDVTYHPAMFAYSMLYPYSDNYLDDPSVPTTEKETFNTWFTQRLHGECRARNAHEEQISKLVGLIEQVFDRQRYPNVYESLLWIQEAQVASLHQQDGREKRNDEELLHISYQKGGTSVVADGYLINGDMNEEQVKFCMQYGFMLQIGDDIQDAIEDHQQHHQTLASNHHEQLQALTQQVMAYTQYILQPNAVCQDQALLNFVERDCILLIIFSIMQIPHAYEEAFFQEIEQCIPMSISFMESLKDQFPTFDEAQIKAQLDCLVA